VPKMMQMHHAAVHVRQPGNTAEIPPARAAGRAGSGRSVYQDRHRRALVKEFPFLVEHDVITFLKGPSLNCRHS
jgi:hypothetical protein